MHRLGKYLWRVLLVLSLVPASLLAQQLLPDGMLHDRDGASLPKTAAPPLLAATVPLPRMSAELALQTYQDRSAQQASALAAYSDTTVIEVELPDSAQHGRYELTRRYAAPRTLQFTPVRFIGDSFVKGNVIVRLLQSEAEHVGKEESAQTAISDRNYKFSFKGTEDLEGRPAYVFQIKPRQKRPGLIKGRIWVDPYTGSLRRVEGSMVKSPSWFVKKVDFVQDYEEIRGFTFPVHLRSVAKARIIGRTVVDILHRDYVPSAVAPAIHANNTGFASAN